jgi:hypothetical protein
VYSSGLFGNSYEYVVIQSIDKFCGLRCGQSGDQGARGRGIRAAGGETAECALSANSFQSTRLSDLSNPSDTPPQIIVSTRVRIAPGRMPDFENIIKTDVLPAYKKLKVTYTVNCRGLGTNSNDVTLSTGYTKYADLDAPNPIVRALGPDGARPGRSGEAAVEVHRYCHSGGAGGSEPGGGPELLRQGQSRAYRALSARRAIVAR